MKPTNDNHADHSTEAESETGTVLVADDDPTLRNLARVALEKDGHTVIVAANGEEACRLFGDQVPDVVLLDVGMPIVDGYEACVRIRTDKRGAHVPILVLTASGDVEAVTRAFAVRATDFQTKPVSWRVLRERVKYMMRSKRDADELLQRAQYDDLTGLLNRAAFRRHLQGRLRAASIEDYLVAVIFLDLDGFKEINDTFGHGFGDEILKLAAGRLAQGVRSSDPLSHPGPCDEDEHVAGRFGGDEFTACIADVPDVETATAVADRIRAALERPFAVGGHEVFVTASTGVSVYPRDGLDADTLLKHADAAMYDAKSQGRNKHALYRPAIGKKMSGRLALASDLRRAVERAEFRVHYQPKVSIDSGRIVGAEALIRWQHPNRGLVVPGDFIDLAEEIGLGPAIGTWLLDEILSHVVEWTRLGLTVPPVALNLSHSQFHVTGLLDQFTEAIRRRKLDAGCLEVEITENVVVDNSETARSLLAGFQAAGIRTAIDDFGTGQSALSTLSSLPADILKIDRSFVEQLNGADHRGRAIAASIIDIGHHLGMTVIAEGVETERQREILRGLGCDEAQGFLFSRGVAREEFTALIADQHPNRATPRVIEAAAAASGVTRAAATEAQGNVIWAPLSS